MNNCEELRVFDDLQNINPFEEGFRRAVEVDGSERESYGTLTYQDTLHTPQILRSIIEIENCLSNAESDRHLPIQIEHESLKDNIPITAKLKEPQLNHQTPLLPKPLFPAVSITTTCVSQISGSDHNRNKESVKNKLKNILLNNYGTNTERKRKETVPSIFIGASSSITISDSDKLTFASNELSHDIATSKSNISREVSRKRAKVERTEFANLKVERNRAAARRYRTKMKIQSQALQEKYEKSQKELTVVRKEFNELKKELTQMKALLLIHKDCPVSKDTVTNQQ